MRRLILLLLPLLVGCATYSKSYIGPGGDIRTCQVTGQGIVGMSTANNAVNKCGQSLEALGYLEMHEAGMVGIWFKTDSLELLRVDEGPAADAGIKIGMIVEAVNGQSIHDSAEASILMFGRAGESVTITVDGKDYELVRVPRVVD